MSTLIIKNHIKALPSPAAERHHICSLRPASSQADLQHTAVLLEVSLLPELTYNATLLLCHSSESKLGFDWTVR